MYVPVPKPNVIRYKRTAHVVETVRGMSLASIRRIMQLFSKHPNLTPDHLLPKFGITLGEFCVAYVVK